MSNAVGVSEFRFFFRGLGLLGGTKSEAVGFINFQHANGKHFPRYPSDN